MKHKISLIIEKLYSIHNPVDVTNEIIMIESEIRDLLAQIKISKSLKESEPQFSDLEKIQITLARLLFKEEFELPRHLVDFVRDFDRVDDLDMREYLYLKIKKNNYLI